MASSNSVHRTVKLDYVRQNNIVLVDLNEKVTESVFEMEYQKAARIISKIIRDSKDKTRDHNPHCRSCKSTSCNSCRHRDRRGCGGNDMRKYSLTEFQTAVPFIGDRGTGKSSVMCSVLESLRCYRGWNENAPLNLGKEHDKIRFITFDMIDANTLKARENIMEIILSRMLSYLEEIQPEGDFRELYRMIDELHKDLGLIYWKDSDKREGYGLAALQRVADSQKTIHGFRALVEQFTREVSAYQFDGDPCYLVIALDDIDMYQGGPVGMPDSHFALLEHIYNHMRIPGLIVLMTFNEHILRRKCNDHFAVIYNGPRGASELTQTKKEDIEELTAQFMSKLFPQERRIYLPNYLFVNSENRSNLYVTPTIGEVGNPDKQALLMPFTDDQSIPIKEFMLRLIAHKTGVYFDAAGRKKHFFEPRNLRELGELFQVIYSMDEVGDETEKETVMARNRQELLEYLYNQFALRHLFSGEYRQFTRLSALPLDRQGRTLVDMIQQHRLDLRLPEDHIAYIDRTKRDRWKYSYGELLHNIYFSTRMPERPGSDRTFYSKEFVHCILGAHSVIMNQNIESVLNTDRSSCGYTKTEGYKLMKSVMGSSVSGRWANEMLPDFQIGDARAVVGAGSISLPIRYFFDWTIPEAVVEAVLALHRDCNENVRCVLSQYMQAFAVIGMFFTGFPHNGLKIVSEFTSDEEKNAVISLRSNSEDHVCFNVLNFVINLYDAEAENGYLQWIRSKLLKLGEEFTKQRLRDWEGEVIAAAHAIEKRAAKVRGEDPYIFSSDVRDEELKDPQIKEYCRIADNANLWMSMTYADGFEECSFLENWKQIVAEACNQLEADIRAWHDKYPRFPLVLPVQHFDMMYNMVKRLANVYYHDIPEEAPADEVYEYYGRLYQNVIEELEAQDQAYHLTEKMSFAQAFKDSVFYQKFWAAENKNPYVKQILVEMMKKAIRAQYARTSAAGL